MTKIEMLMEMFRIQLEKDKKVNEEFGITYQGIVSRQFYFSALLDKLGEWCHTLSPYWCWWKIGSLEPDEAKVLDKFLDITQFVLSYCLAVNSIDPDPKLNQYLVYGEIPKNWEWDKKLDKGIFTWKTTVRFLLMDFDCTTWHVPKNERLVIITIPEILSYWNHLIELAKYDFEKDIYEPFIKRNDIAQQRIEDGL